MLSEKCELKRLQRSQQLHVLERFPNEISVRSIWFTDKKTFNAATPVNSRNGGAYSVETKKRQVPKRRPVRKRDHLSRGVMVSVSVSEMGKTSVVSVEPGAKLNGGCMIVNIFSDDACCLFINQGTCGLNNCTLQQDGNSISHDKFSSSGECYLHRASGSCKLNRLFHMGRIVRKSLPEAKIYHSRGEFKLAINDEERNLGQRSIDCKRLAPTLIKSR